MMAYDPFARGSAAVGVTTIERQDSPLGQRSVPLELWYPAAEAYRGCDYDDARRDRFIIAPGFPERAQHAVRNAAAARGAFPLFMYFHGGYGERRECTHLCTHLASHGYIVVAANFPGDSILDLMPRADGSQATIATTPIDESARKRPAQACAFIDQILSTALPEGLRIEPEQIGTGGFSMGGYTSLALNSLDRRPTAAFAMCPMYGERSLVPQVRRLQNLLHVDDWGRPVPTCILSGELDPFVNVDDMLMLYEQLAIPKFLAVLRRAGHLHWADGAEVAHEQYRLNYLSGDFPDPEIDAIALGTAMRPFSELCTEQQAGDTARGLCLAHLDTYLKGAVEARAFLAGDLTRTFAQRGIELNVQVAIERTCA